MVALALPEEMPQPEARLKQLHRLARPGAVSAPAEVPVPREGEHAERGLGGVYRAAAAALQEEQLHQGLPRRQASRPRSKPPQRVTRVTCVTTDQVHVTLVVQRGKNGGGIVGVVSGRGYSARDL